MEIGGISADHGEKFKELLGALPGPILAFCRSGKRAAALHELAKQNATVEQQPVSDACNWGNAFDVVVIGGGSAGIGVTASLLKRRPALRIAIIEPSDKHYYQPAWTLVGGGAYDIAATVRTMSEVIPKACAVDSGSSSQF